MTDSYRPTEAKYKGGAEEMYVTYDLYQRTRGGKRVEYPKVKRVYIAGDVIEWQPGMFQKRTGRQVHGVRIEYEQRRAGYRRRGFTASRGGRRYDVEPASAKPTAQRQKGDGGQAVALCYRRGSQRTKNACPGN